MIAFNAVILAIAVLGNIFLALLTLRRNTKSATHRLFTLLGMVFALWAIATFLGNNVQTEIAALWWVRITMMLAVPQAVLFMLLMQTFPKTKMVMSKKGLTILTAVTLLVMAVTLSPYLFTEVKLTIDGAPQPTPGLGMILFIPLAIGSVLVGLFYLIKKNIKGRGIEKLQARYLLVGALTMFALIIGFSFIGVAFFKKASLSDYGPLFTLPFVALTSYAIIRHRLMDIRVAIARSLSFTALIAAFFAIYGTILIFAVPYLSTLTGISDGIIAAIGALLSLPIAKYIQEKLRNRYRGSNSNRHAHHNIHHESKENGNIASSTKNRII